MQADAVERATAVDLQGFHRERKALQERIDETRRGERSGAAMHFDDVPTRDDIASANRRTPRCMRISLVSISTRSPGRAIGQYLGLRMARGRFRSWTCCYLLPTT